MRVNDKQYYSRLTGDGITTMSGLLRLYPGGIDRDHRTNARGIDDYEIIDYYMKIVTSTLIVLVLV